MEGNQWKPWSVKYREMVNNTKEMTAEEPADPIRKKLKTRMAFQTTLDAVRDRETETSEKKGSEKNSNRVSESKKSAISSRV